MDGFQFEDLDVYQKARAFKCRVYKLCELLPPDERFRLRSQMRGAALSITNCLAEGHGRYTFRDRHRFCIDSRGSLAEIVDDINDCLDNQYAKDEHLADLRKDAGELNRLLNGYIRYLRVQIKKRGEDARR
jgi:four helix bundle protein